MDEEQIYQEVEKDLLATAKKFNGDKILLGTLELLVSSLKQSVLSTCERLGVEPWARLRVFPCQKQHGVYHVVVRDIVPEDGCMSVD